MNKLSKYNHIFTSTRGEYLIYNGLTNSFAKLNQELHDLLKKAAKNPNHLLGLDKDSITALKSANILVDDYTEADQIYTKRAIWNAHAYNSHTLNLTIAPTSNCNFRCSYCYENGIENKAMTIETVDKLVSFIKSYTKVDGVHITWYGGEPLLAVNTIKQIQLKLKEEKVKILSQDMITNGYLLNSHNRAFIIKSDIKFLQITLDGDEQIHNQRRPHVNPLVNTWNVITQNIADFLKEEHDVRISIRCNIDKTNVDRYIQLNNKLNELFKNDKRVTIYPGIITGESNPCQNNCSIMNNNDVADFYLEIAEKLGDNVYFSFESTTCGSGQINTFVVGTEGELYKCWNDLGRNERIVGYIDERKYDVNPWLTRYMAGPTMFDDEKCKHCTLFFQCNGGCPWKRLENKYHNKSYELCSIQKERMNDFLQAHFLQKTKQKAL